MRYSVKLTIYLMTIVLGFMPQVNAEVENGSVQYTSLSRKFHISPNGRHNAIIVENKYPLGSEFSLHLITMHIDGYNSLNSYSLTPRYDIFVETPDGNIAFVSFDTVNQYKAHIYNPTKIEIEPALESSDNKITKLQFSTEMTEWGIYQDFSAHPLASKKQKQNAEVNRKFYNRDGGWIILTEDGYCKTKSGDIIFSDKEKENFTTWSPIRKPKKLPEMFTQQMPNITLDTQIHWSPDSDHIYVLDKKGIWRLTLGNVFFPLWTQIVINPHITDFQVSSFGTILIYKTKPRPEVDNDYLIKLTGLPIGLNKLPDIHELTFDIWMVDLRPLVDKVPSPTQEELISVGGPIWLTDATRHLSSRKLTRALDATFNPIGKTIEFSTFIGQYGVKIETLQNEKRIGTGHIYD